MATTRDRQAAAGESNPLLDQLEELAKSLGVDLSEGEEPLNKARSKEGDAAEDGDEEEGEETEEEDEDDAEGAPGKNKRAVAGGESAEVGVEKGVTNLDLFKAIAGNSETLEKSLEAQDRINLFSARAMKALFSEVASLGDTVRSMAKQPGALRATRASETLSKGFMGTDEAPVVTAEDKRVMEARLQKAILADMVPLSAMSHFDRTGRVPEKWESLVKAISL